MRGSGSPSVPGLTKPSSEPVRRGVDWAFLERSLVDRGRRRRRVERRVPLEGRLRLLADATALMLVVVVTALTGWGLRPEAGPDWLAVSALGVLLSLALANSYRPSPRLSLREELRSALVAPLVALGVWSVRLLVTGEELPAASLVLTWLLLSGAVVAARATVRRLVATRALASGSTSAPW